MQVLSLTGSLVLLFFLFFILKSFLSLPFTSRYAVEAFFKSFFYLIPQCLLAFCNLLVSI